MSKLTWALVIVSLLCAGNAVSARSLKGLVDSSAQLQQGSSSSGLQQAVLQQYLPQGQQPYQSGLQQDPTAQQQQAPSAPTQQPASGSTAAGSFATKQSGTDVLALHNAYRAVHGAPALTWDDSLRASAKQWADHLAAECSFYHSGPGENLASGFTQWDDVMWAFYEEYKQYNYNAPGYSSATGHFTQLIWKDTQRVGCDVSQSNCWEGMIFACHYDPAGNVNAPQYFQANVLPPQ